MISMGSLLSMEEARIRLQAKAGLVPAKLSSQAASASSCKAARWKLQSSSVKLLLSSCQSLKLCKPSAKISFKLKGWLPKPEANEASEPSKRPESSSEGGFLSGSSSAVQAAGSKLLGAEAPASKALTLASVFCKLSWACSACCSQKAATDEADKAEADEAEAA